MIKNNPSFQSTNAINEITTPLMKTHQLSYFGFVRIYPDKSFINLVTDNSWSEYHYFEKKLPPAHLLNYDSIQDQMLLFHENSDELIGWPKHTIKELHDRFSILNMLNIVKRHDRFIDVIGIVSNRNDPINYFLNNMAFIGSFINLFKDKAQSIIKEASKNPLYYEAQNGVIQNRTQSITPPIIAKRHTLYTGELTVLLTRREYDVLSLFAKGHSVKSAAIMLDISPRTVEDYFNKVRHKFGHKTRQELITIFWKNQMTQLML